MNPESEYNIDALLNRSAIIDVVNRFATAMDRQDWHLMRGLFANHVDADYSQATGQPRSTITGDQFVSAMQGIRNRPNLVTQHLLTNHAVTLQGERAACVTYYVAQHHNADFADGSQFDVHGWYADELARSPDGWRIDRRTITVLWAVGNPKILGL